MVITRKKLDLIFAETASDLLINIKSYLEKENLKPLSMNIIREHNSFCAVIVGESRRIFFS